MDFPSLPHLPWFCLVSGGVKQEGSYVPSYYLLYQSVPNKPLNKVNVKLMDTALDYNNCMGDKSLSEASLLRRDPNFQDHRALYSSSNHILLQKTTFWTLQGKRSLLPTFFEQSTLQCEISKNSPHVQTRILKAWVVLAGISVKYQKGGRKQAVSAIAIEAKFSFSLRGRLPFSSELCTLNLQSSQSLTIKGIYKITSTRTD